MRPLYSEFSFGFGISHEILTTLSLVEISAPVLPSLLDEGDLGYDVNFQFSGGSLFLQFKRSDALIRMNAKEWLRFRQPYYRFRLARIRESQQHNLIRALARSEPHVYYCAPLFHTDVEFNGHYLNRTLLDNSMAFNLRNLPGLTDNDQHSISYTRYFGIFSTEPKPIEGIPAKEFVKSLGLPEVRKSFERGISVQYLVSLWETIRTIAIGEDYRIPIPDIDYQKPVEIIRALRLVTRSYFGLEWFLLHFQKGRHFQEK